MLSKIFRNTDKVLLIFLLAPFFVISIFNHPASDDFDFSFKTRDYGFWGAQVYRYMNEGGRYFANGIISLDPLVVKAYWAFKVLPILVLGLFVFSVFYFFSNVFKDYDKKVITRLSVIFFFIYFAQIIEVSSAFYWFTGAMTYQLPTSLTLLFFGTLVKYMREKKLKWLLLLCLLLIMLMGCNEVTTLLFLVVTIVVWGFLKYQKERIPIFYYVLLLVVLITAGFEFLAPGNSVRATTIDIAKKQPFVHVVLRTGLSALKFFFKWFPLLFLVSTYIFPLFKKIKFLDIRLTFLMTLGVLFVAMFPGFWTSDAILPERAQNTIYFYFIFPGIYFGLVLLNYLQSEFNFELSSGVRKIVFIGILLFSFSNTSIYHVYNDLVAFKAYRYNQEMTKRYEIIENSTEKELVLPALSPRAKPQTLYAEPIMGLTNSKYNWKNMELKDYYHKEIIIVPTDSIFTE